MNGPDDRDDDSVDAGGGELSVSRIDHIVLTVRSIRATCDFYTRVLGMREVAFDAGRIALAFGEQRINLHQLGAEFEPKAAAPTAGAADLSFITEADAVAVVAHLRAHAVEVLAGPVPRTGAMGQMTSVYFRDPDGNLLEVSRYDRARA
jgi:catechol 2,3-dioxygenase-like lactoylglutathione lyase family enzyme